MSKITNDVRFNQVWHSCIHMATVGVRGLIYRSRAVFVSDCLARCIELHFALCCEQNVTHYGSHSERWSPVWAQQRCRISPSRFLAECRKRRLNQASFRFAVFCVVCFFWVVFSFCSVSVFYLSSVTYFPACTDANGTV